MPGYWPEGIEWTNSRGCTPAEIEEWLHVMVEHRLASQQLGADTPYDAGFIEGAIQRFKEPSDPH